MKEKDYCEVKWTGSELRRYNTALTPLSGHFVKWEQRWTLQWRGSRGEMPKASGDFWEIERECPLLSGLGSGEPRAWVNSFLKRCVAEHRTKTNLVHSISVSKYTCDNHFDHSQVLRIVRIVHWVWSQLDSFSVSVRHRFHAFGRLFNYRIALPRVSPRNNPCTSTSRAKPGELGEIFTEVADGAVWEGEWMLEDGFVQLTGSRRHDVLVLSRTFVSCSVVLCSQTAQYTQPRAIIASRHIPFSIS